MNERGSLGIVMLLVVGIAGLVGLVMFPTVSTIVAEYTAESDTPLYDIVKLLPLAFIGLCIVGAIWAMSRSE